MGLYFLYTPETSGWIPPEMRSMEVANRHLEIMDACPVVGTTGYYGARPKWSVAWEYQGRVANFDQWLRKGHVKNMQQLTGSCVGFGAANMLLWTSITQLIYNADKYRVSVPFFGYHYGLGRLESGIRGRGEGSTGSGQAEALKKYGWLAFDSLGVPSPNNGEVIEWSSQAEMQWSDGNGPSQSLKPEGSKHVITEYTRATSRDQSKDLMASKYWGTTASTWGGLMQCPVAGAGNNRVLLNRGSGRWNHQQWVAGYWEHPELGDLFAIGNNWGYVHGEDPQRTPDENTPPTAPPGIYWVNGADFDRMLSGGETFFFSAGAGFEARPGLYSLI